MFLKNSKFLAFLLVLIWTLVYAGATVCLANNQHSCCPPEESDCPIVTLQSAPAIVQAKLINPAVIEIPVSSTLDRYVFSLKPEFVRIIYELPQYHLLAKLGHLSTAPPQA